MQSLEKTLMANAPCPVILWRWFVDDCIAILKRQDMERFLVFINGLNSNFVFTQELEDNCSLPFLDILINRKEDGSFMFGVYRKLSHTGKYLDYDSLNPYAHKRSVLMLLVYRALKICSKETLDHELETVTKMLTDNGYPLRMIKQIIWQRKRQHHKNMQQQNHLPASNNSITAPQPGINSITAPQPGINNSNSPS